MTPDHQILWKAYCEAGDYFSRLGGSGRYTGFSEYHIPALVFILAIEKSEPRGSQDGALRHLLPEQIWTGTDGLPFRVSKIVDELTCMEQGQMRRFVGYVNTIYMKKAPDELVLWENFLKKVDELGWHI